jgi:murein DD-endopeptidase MepM/ murein hydrolase activator NlpD
MNRRVKLACVVALALLAPALAACTPSTPETQFSWGVDDHVGPGRAYHSAPAPKQQHQARTYIYQSPDDADRAEIPKPKPRPAYAAAAARQDTIYDRAELSERRTGTFSWPASGRVISGFGTTTNGERNDGINIATPMGTPIHAAAGGTVSYSGNELKDYGNLLLIKHPGGYVTAYAHADQLLVHSGDTVTKGQVIGYSGRTGDVSTPQLHFEIRHDTTPLNPGSFLVPRGSLG